jgi:hypothetical protein
VRLTLRTLLAYLDDTLEPSEIKQIGQKVAESDAAQELIARIKQITRRRRLTTPPLTGPGAANFDPNTVAEYLDNALTGDQIADVEKLCLESDVHLAEIATCHQILTLVLGEPALVPPTARERMYGLVQGKESIPFRKAPIAATPSAARPGSYGDDGDDAPFGSALARRGGLPRWVVPAAGILLVVGLILTLIKVMPGVPQGRQVQVAADTPKKAEDQQPSEPPAPAAKVADTGDLVKDEQKGQKAAAETNPQVRPMPPTAPVDASTSPGPKTPEATAKAAPAPASPPPQQPKPAVTPSGQAAAPAQDRREIGTYRVVPGNGPTLLVQRRSEEDPWVRLTPDARVYSADPLVSLPGFMSEMRLDSGVHLQMRGMIPEFATDDMMNFLLDSSVVLHANKDVDLDFTLLRGRVYLSNHKEKGPARVRLRFDREIWLVTLAEPDSEILVELIKHYDGSIRWQEGEEPYASLLLGVIKGKGSLDADYHAFPNLEMPGPSLFIWDNKGHGLVGPKGLPRPFPQWDKSPPNNKETPGAMAAMESLSKRMIDNKSVNVVLMEGLVSPSLPERILSIRSFGALDQVQPLLDVLGDEDENHGWERIAAISVLQRWLSRGPEMGKRLYDPEKRSGLLTLNYKYLSGEAETILKLLYGYTYAEQRSADTYRALADYLLSKKIAIRELAIRHLIHMGAPIKFNPGWTEAERKKATAEVNKLVDEHKLPPPTRAPQGVPGVSGGR